MNEDIEAVNRYDEARGRLVDAFFGMEKVDLSRLVDNMTRAFYHMPGNMKSAYLSGFEELLKKIGYLDDFVPSERYAKN